MCSTSTARSATGRSRTTCAADAACVQSSCRHRGCRGACRRLVLAVADSSSVSMSTSSSPESGPALAGAALQLPGRVSASASAYGAATSGWREPEEETLVCWVGVGAGRCQTRRWRRSGSWATGSPPYRRRRTSWVRSRNERARELAGDSGEREEWTKRERKRRDCA